MSELSIGQLRGLTVNSNTVTVPAGHTLYAPGHVIQVVSTTKTDTFSLASTTFTAIPNFSITITPKSTSSKILVMVSINSGSNQNEVTLIQRLMRDTTPIGVGDAAGSRTQGNTLRVASSTSTLSVLSSYQFLDSPSTTSAITYSVQVRGENAYTFYVNRTEIDNNNAQYARASSTITCMEIAQ
jgi:hypothetical protein